MSKITKEISVDVSKRNMFEAIVAKQRDTNSRFLKVTLCNEGKKISVPQTAQAVLNVRRADKSSMAFLGTVNSDGTVTVPLTSWVLGLDDVVSCSVSIIGDDEQRLTSTSFEVNVEAAEYCGDDISEEEAEDVLTQLLATAAAANTATENANDAAQAAAQAAEDAATAKNQANSARDYAVQAANTAASKSGAADTAANKANTAAQAANTAAEAATTAATAANSAAEDVNALLDSVEVDTLLNGVDDIKSYIGYTTPDILGLQVDYENNVFTRLAGAVGKTQGADFDTYPMYGGRRRCNVSDDGTITAWYGDDNFVEDGSNGQVMVYQPRFYYRVVPIKLEPQTSGLGYHIRKANYYVSANPRPGFKLHPAFYDENGKPIDYVLMSAYEGTLFDASENSWVEDNTAYASQTVDTENDLLGSLANGCQPISYITKPNFEKIGQNRGAGWHLETIKITSANQLLMMIEIGMMNTQTAIGQGVVSITDNTSLNCSRLVGSTSSLGNGTGQAASTVDYLGVSQTENGKTSVTYRGVENPWGNVWKHINGINIWGDGTMCGGQPYIADDFNFNESKHDGNYHPIGFTLANATGYIKAMGYGSEEYDWLLIPSETGGTSALPVGDYCYMTDNLNGYRIARLGSGWNVGGGAGGFGWFCMDGVGQRGRSIGGRLVYVPTERL